MKHSSILAKTTIKETNIHDTRTGYINTTQSHGATVLDKKEMKFSWKRNDLNHAIVKTACISLLCACNCTWLCMSVRVAATCTSLTGT